MELSHPWAMSPGHFIHPKYNKDKLALPHTIGRSFGLLAPKYKDYRSANTTTAANSEDYVWASFRIRFPMSEGICNSLQFQNSMGKACPGPK